MYTFSACLSPVSKRLYWQQNSIPLLLFPKEIYIDDLLQVGILSSVVFDAKLNKFARPQQGQIMSIRESKESRGGVLQKVVWGLFLEKLWKKFDFAEFFHIKNSFILHFKQFLKKSNYSVQAFFILLWS